jgi:hypothetical protein
MKALNCSEYAGKKHIEYIVTKQYMLIYMEIVLTY